jgi:nucleoside-triphosphatase
MQAQKIFLTGPPGCGKTTAIRKIIAQLDCHAGGFFTQEVREGGRRVGFKVITLDGEEGYLAHVKDHSRARIGKYGVDLESLDQIGVAAIRSAIDTKDLVIIDEIGPMEILSPKFRQIVLAAIWSDRPVLGTISRRKGAFTDQVRAFTNVQIIHIRRDNQADIITQILNQLKRNS